MLVYKEGDILKSWCQTLVCTVNCMGVMGKGLALQFKKSFPRMFTQYKDVCLYGTKLKRGGDLWLFTYPDLENSFWWDDEGNPNVGWQSKILCFATKEQWRYPSKYEWIERGLQNFVNSYKEMGIKSIAFPKLGCTNGGLEWEKVKEIMEKYLSDLDIKVEIWV